MPFQRQTLTALRNAAAADINAALPGVDALLRFSNLGIMGDVMAALANGLYGYLDWIALQAVPFTATGEYLEGWAALKSVVRKPATLASGSVTFTGTSGTIASGTPVIRSDGAQFTTTGSGTVAGGSVVVPVIAVSAGSIGNTPIGVTMNLGAGISGVNGQGSVTAAIAGGADVELDDALRGRMIAAYSNPAQGGSVSDYISWALQVPGVTRAWVNPGAYGAGTVAVLFMMDQAESSHGGFPQGTNGVATAETRDTVATGDQLVVANYLFNLQPATALVYAVAPTQNTIALTIAGIAGASSTVKTAIAAAFATALQASGVPGGSTPLSAIEAAIGSVSGSSGFVITLVTASAGSVSPGSAGNITSNAGALPVPGAITYV